MPAIQSKIEGRGNGIKTNIPNMVDVAKALARPPTYTTKYLSYELGAVSKCDDKSGTYIVNGAHTAQVLSQHLEGFIKRFVQCHACGNPETVINITKKDTITLKCKACGFVSDVDMRHKLTTFILKNPPEKDKNASKKDKQLRRAEKEREEEGAELDRQAEEERRRRKKEAKEGKGEKKSKKEKKEKKEKKSKKSKGDDDDAEGSGSPKRDSDSEPEPSDDDDDDDDDDTVWATDTSAVAALGRAKEQLTDASAAMVEVAADELEKKAAIEAAAAEESESEEEEDERIAKVRGYVTKHDAKETAEYLVSDKLGCESKELGVHFLVEALFDEDEPLVPQIKAKKAYMIAACGQDANLQTALVCAVELFITESATEQFKQYVAILKELYDEDVLDEEIILKWGADPKSAAKFGVDLETSQAVRKQVKPFLEWLAQDDSDSD